MKMVKFSVTSLAALGIALSSCVTAQAHERPMRSFADRAIVQIANSDFRVQSPPREDAVVLSDEGAARFSLYPGDQWTSDKEKGQRVERAEIASTMGVHFGDTTYARFRFRLDGADLDPMRGWLVLAQLHGPNASDLPQSSPLRPPPFAVRLGRDGMQFLVRNGTAQSRDDGKRIAATVPFVAGKWYDVAVRIRLGDDKGRVTVWVDEDMIVDRLEPVGYRVSTSRHYWKFGLYQSAQATGLRVAEFSHIDLGVDPLS